MDMEMGERRWEELEVNCLAHIFARLTPDDKVLSLPFVCKSWYRASLDPICWRSLNFVSPSPWPSGPMEWRFYRQYPRTWFSFSGLLKLALHRSQGSTTKLYLPRAGYNVYDDLDICQEDLELVAKECLGIKVFSYTQLDGLHQRIPKMVANWENLETLCVRGSELFLEETLAAVKEHCPRFGTLVIAQVRFSENKETKAVVSLLPRLKRLALVRVYIRRKCLNALLDGCKELEELRLRYCSGFSPGDYVMKRAAAIRTFVYESPLSNEFEYLKHTLFPSDIYDENSD